MTVDRMHDTCRRQWVACEEPVEPIPRKVRPLRAPAQPRTPGTFRLVPEAVQRLPVAGDAVVREVPFELPHQGLVLIFDRQMTVGRISSPYPVLI